MDYFTKARVRALGCVIALLGLLPLQAYAGRCDDCNPPPPNVAPSVTLLTPTANQTFVVGSTINITANASDYDGTISRVDLKVDGVKRGSDTAAPYAFTWTATLGSHQIMVLAYDNAQEEVVDAVTINVVANQSPTVSVTAPTSGQYFATGSAVTLGASAADADGTVARVDFYVDSVYVGQDTTAPYAIAWTGTMGNHSLTAQAVDAMGAATMSAAVPFSVDLSPTVAITAPASGQAFANGSTITLAANAADSDGSILRVDFFVDNVLVAQDGAAPFATTWSGTSGNHSVKAIAYDNLWWSGTSTSIAFTVNANVPPNVAITTPTANQAFAAGTTVNFAASASDVDGTVARVEFYVDNINVGSDAAAPFTFAWSGGASGAHSVKAIAFDTFNLSTTSATVAFSINPNVPPAVSLIAPTAGQGVGFGSVLTLTANASDSDGSVQRVEFYADGTKVGEDTAAPFTWNWAVTDLGTHTVYAKAFDNANASATTASVDFSVVSTPGSMTRSYVYDPSTQELCKVIEPETGSTVMAYDLAGNLSWSATGLALPKVWSCDTADASVAARKATRTYDVRNRVSTLVFPDNRGNTMYAYQPDGLVQSTTAVEGANTVTTTYAYNNRRLLTGERLQYGSVDWTIGYDYNLNGNLDSQTYPGLLTVDYAPNALGQPTKAGTYATNVSYYPNGAIHRFTYGNGVVHEMNQNARQLPDRSWDSYVGEPVVHDDSYAYDGVGNVVAISDGVAGHRGDRDMTYDFLGRLRTATSTAMFGGTYTYTYDVLDNIATVDGPGANDLSRYCYEAGTNRLQFLRTGTTTNCSDGSATTVFEYDVQGNQTRKNNVRYDFDFGNRLRGVTDATLSTTIATYVYDGSGRRVRDNTTAAKYSMYTRSGQLGFTANYRKSEFTNYIYLGGSLVATRTSPLDFASSTVKYQHTDALGSPVAVTDSSRVVLERSEYNPYGKSSSVSNDGPGYTGHVEDSSTALTYMQQRYYDPQLGRFLSMDPVAVRAIGDNFNRYWYGGNNPYKVIDPDGRDGEFAYGAAVGISPWISDKDKGIILRAELAAREQNAVAGIYAGTAVKSFAEQPQITYEGLKHFSAQLLVAVVFHHGNSKLDMRPQHRYIIRDAKGDVVKTGISGRPLNLDGTSPRANQQVNKLNRQAGLGAYTAEVVEKDIPGRAAALDAERAATTDLKREGNSLRLQQRPAGKDQ